MSSSPTPSDAVLREFSDCHTVKVTVPLTEEKTLHLDGVIKKPGDNLLDIRFPSQPLPVEDLAEAGRWRITFEKGLSFLNVWGRLSELLSPQRVLLAITGTDTNRYARRDHRVNTEIYLRYWQAGDGRQALAPHRTRVNLSGYGISFASNAPPPAHSLVELELFLPGSTLERVRCLGRVIRSSSQQKQDSAMALELVNPGENDIEKIINFCMAEQFRDMQQKAHMLAAGLGPEKN